MKTTIVSLAVGSALSASTALYAAPNPPQPAIKATELHHGYQHASKDLRAPSAQSQRSLKAHKPKLKKQQPKLKLQQQQLTLNAMTPQATAVAPCNVNAFATSNSTSLINEIKNQGANCVNDLFNADAGIQTTTFSSDNMYAVANEAKRLSEQYQGGGDNQIEALFLFIRAGYYVEFYNNNVSFVSWVKPAVKAAIDAFVNNSHFYDDNDAHAKTMGEVITTMDSSEQQDVYLPVVKQWLSRWNQSYAAKWNMRNAVNGIFTILFRGQYNANFKSLVATDTTLIASLNDFTQKSWMINSDAEFLIANAARELGRMKMYTGTAIQPSVDAGLNAIFANYQMYGNGDAVWLGAADTASYYGNCSDYGICNYGEQLRAKALTQTYTCSPTLKIFSQDLTPTQQASICTTEGAEETFFHQKVQDNTPIPGDNNTQLHINIFNSDNDYGKYAGPIFDMNTNNGGMYLEGDPSSPTNVPNFVAYEASYANAPHYVWNLEHEYVHYLDGRFDLYGNFNTPTEKVVWWAEGLAEYISKREDNQAAIDTIHDGTTYSLSAIFETTYDGFDQDRIYRWGYLAVRFMFENHPADVKAMIAETRVGDWAAYKARVNTWVANYSNEFANWIQTVKSTPTTPPTGNQAPTANANGPYSASVNQAILFSSANSTDSDGSIVSYSWDFGDGSTSNQANPSHQYTQAGNYTASLTVTDDGGLTGTSSAQVTITAVSNNLAFANGETKTGLSAATNESTSDYFIDVPVNTDTLTVAIAGGTGDADLYLNQGSAPTSSQYQCRPYRSGNNETCTINNPVDGRWYFHLTAYQSFADVSLTAQYQVAQAPVNQAPVAQINGSYQAEQGVAIDFSSAGSYDADGQISQYLWDFGDGNTSTSANPSHSYSNAGSYTVSLSVTDDKGATDVATTTATIYAGQTTSPVADMCAIQGAQSSGRVTAGEAICLGQVDPIWLSVADVNNHNSITIRTAHGSGDLSLEFSNYGWPNGSNVQGSSYQSGNNECIHLTNLSQYWGYIKVAGGANGASMLVEFDGNGCQ